jgi:DNA-binding transcriptional LysR family regulator
MSDSLTFRLLTYIKAVAETLNFTRAAQRLYLAQPSLSQQIRDLEDQLKVPLFERGGHQIRITDAGRLLVAYADTALRERDEIVAMARAIYLGQVPPLRLGFSSFINAALLQSFREHYEEMFPGCEIHLSGGDPVLILQRLNQRIIDCAILPMPIDEDLYSVQQIAESPLVICMPSNDPLTSHTHVDNYYFLSSALASRLMAEDNQNHLVSQVVAGQVESNDVQVRNVTITSMSEETVQGTQIARGTALVTIDKLFSPQNSREPRTEHWALSITYYLNPKQVSDQARIFPQFETINPLGMTITEFHENRVSVDPVVSRAGGPASQPVPEATR